MKIKVKKSVVIDDGLHEGAVINIRYRHKPFDYVDLIIQTKQGLEAVELKVGYPAIISENSKLGMLLIRFGQMLVEGVEIDPDDVLIGKKIRFKTYTEVNDNGKYARVKPDSVVPIELIQGELQ